MTQRTINNLNELEFAQLFQKSRERIIEDPITHFIEAERYINFKPTPAQRTVLKCIFGKPLDSFTKHEIYQETLDELGEFDLGTQMMTEVELYEFMTGFKYDPTNPIIFLKNRINLIIGRRGGKSTLASIIALFSTFKVNWKPFLKKTPVATVLVMSHSVEFSEEVLDILRELVENSPILSRLRDLKKKNTQRIFHLKIPFLTPDGKSIEYSRVRVKVGAASKKTTRGSAICTLLCDEIAFWNLADDAAESDVDILRAVRPALLQFGEHGTIIKLSSPGIKQGILYEEWNKREHLERDFFQFKAPSWVWNTILPKEEFKKEWRSDQDGFDTEYRANFVDSISNFILPEFVDLCVMRGTNFLPPSDDSKTVYTAAIDAAFKGDRFAFALTGYNEKRVTNYVLKYWEGSKKNPVQIHEVASYIRNICKEYGINIVTADQYSFQPLREIFLQYGVTLEENTFTLPYKRKIYFGMKRLIHNSQMDLLDIPLLAKEIKELKVEQTASGQIRIGHPPGGSDDLSDALAVAAYKSLEKAGVVNIMSGDISGAMDYGVRTDIAGRAFSAPPVELLQEFSGFRGTIDNSGEFMKDPKTGNWVKRSEVEDLEGTNSDGPNFVF